MLGSALADGREFICGQMGRRCRLQTLPVIEITTSLAPSFRLRGGGPYIAVFGGGTLR